MPTRLVAAIFLATLGCGGAGGDAEEAPTSAAELICSPRVRDECGLSRADCLPRADATFQQCVGVLVDLADLEHPNREQRERVGLLSTMCTLIILRDQRATEGEACTGESPGDEYRALCLPCSVAAGTVTVADEEADDEADEPVTDEPAPAEPEAPASDEGVTEAS